MAAREKLTGRAAWTGKELEASGDWVKRFRPEHLAEIDAALERLADGTYGVCLVCGRPIPAERLEVRPTATTCVGCATSAEASRRS